MRPTPSGQTIVLAIHGVLNERPAITALGRI
jgi:hypothetical protein